MGIVLKQSLRNAVTTYLGFGIGALNTLFLYTNFLSDEYYGLVQVVLSTSLILMPLFTFGVPNTLIKYYGSFRQKSMSDAFLTLMLCIPLVMIILMGLITFFAYDRLSDFLASENKIVKGYVWYIFTIGLALAYFEIFYAIAKTQMKSVFGNFMKEVFIRLGVAVLLGLVYYQIISVGLFLKLLVGLYLLRMFIMNIYAFTLRPPTLNFNFPKNTLAILGYSSLIILGGSAAIIQLEIDKFMINQYIAIENVAYYSVAIYIAAVIVVPSRAMHQITHPLTARLLENNDIQELKALYQKSSLTLLVISGLLFVLIICNVSDLYLLLPQEYRGGFSIVFLIGLVKVFDSCMGNNNAILYNSEYYRAVLVMGVLLAFLTILFNLWLIPKYGIDGAAYATFLAICIYNIAKIGYVKSKFGILPFTKDTMKVIFLMLGTGILFYLIPFSFHPILNIVVKGFIISSIYLFVIYRFRISEDVHGLFQKFLHRGS